MHIEQRDLTHVYMKCIHQDAFYMNNSLIHVAISIKLHSPGIVEEWFCREPTLQRL